MFLTTPINTQMNPNIPIILRILRIPFISRITTQVLMSTQKIISRITGNINSMKRTITLIPTIRKTLRIIPILMTILITTGMNSMTHMTTLTTALTGMIIIIMIIRIIKMKINTMIITTGTGKSNSEEKKEEKKEDDKKDKKCPHSEEENKDEN